MALKYQFIITPASVTTSLIQNHNYSFFNVHLLLKIPLTLQADNSIY